MKLERSLFVLAVFFIVAVMVSPCFLRDAQAFRGERGDYGGGGGREGGYVEGPRGGAAAEGPRGGAAAEGPDGGVVVRGPQGNVRVGRAVGDRVPYLPDSASPLIVGGQTYFVDDGGVYYLQCTDDNTLFCVVPDPQ
jgi:hypothetical protein